MNKLNPVEAILGCVFDLKITVTGLESTYTHADMYIDDVIASDTGLKNKAITNGLIEFSTTAFSGYTVGPHTYSVVAKNGQSGTTKKVVIYKNSLNVLDNPTATTT